MKKIIPILLALLIFSACQTAPQLSAEMENNFGESQFSKITPEIPGKNANQVYCMRNQSVFGIIINLTLKDILGEAALKLLNPPMISELYSVEFNQDGETTQNYETFLIIRFNSQENAKSAYDAVKQVLRSSNIIITQKAENLLVRVFKKSAEISQNQAKLEGQFANSPLFTGDDIKYGDNIIYSAVLTKKQKDLATSFWELYKRTQPDMLNPEYNESVAIIDKLEDASRLNNKEKLVFVSEEDQMRIIYTAFLTGDKNIEEIKKNYQDSLNNPNLTVKEKEKIIERKNADVTKAIELWRLPDQAVLAIETLRIDKRMLDTEIKYSNGVLQIIYMMPETKFLGRN
jgi:hypothetical protein